MDIRSMTDIDFPEMVKLVAEFSEESLGEYGTYLDRMRLAETFDVTWKTSFVAVVEDKVVGVLAGHIVKDFCSKDPVYEEVIWFMNKEYRKYGVKLFKHVQQWCVVHGIKRMTMCVMHNSKTDTLFALYKKLGFKIMETRFIKQLD